MNNKKTALTRLLREIENLAGSRMSIILEEKAPLMRGTILLLLLYSLIIENENKKIA